MRLLSRGLTRTTAKIGWYPVRAVFVVLTLAMTVGTVSWAHDFWLVPNAFHARQGGMVEVRGQTSSRFPTSESAVAVERVADARLISKGGADRITGLAIDGKSLRLRHRPRRSAQYVVAVSLEPRSIRESVGSFLRYLELEGAPEARRRLEADGTLAGRDSVTRRYAKYAKTFVQVGRGGPRAFAEVAGHPLELLPVRDPSAARRGDTLRFRLLYRGAPLEGARLTAGAVVHSATSLESPVVTSPDTTLVTDRSGEIVVRLGAAGLWNVRGIHIAPAEPGSGADWDTHWVSIVFHAALR
ncbi:MAG: DUF4198 domain-containing protein [Gemmatimonadaceae bacterium]